ncbi:DUF3105 domain-containing protein [Microlunatus sp. Y2014]|uniref:DUF3105 domain-containing protein n=1 Tax=Microlunatus sp. Y2014 TaxID=3418488 RepID=UPI003DA769B7
MARSNRGQKRTPKSSRPSRRNEPTPADDLTDEVDVDETADEVDADEEFVEYDPDAEDHDEEDLDDEDELDDEDDEDLDDELDDDELDDDEDEVPPAKSSGTRDATKPKKQKQTRKQRTRGATSPLGTPLSGGKQTKAGSRRQRLASLEARQKAQQRKKTVGLVALCVVLALAIMAWPLYLYVNDAIMRATPRVEIGVPAAEAGCLPDEENPATGNQEHVPDGTVAPYPRLPPDSGPHYNNWAEFGQTFYDVSDRPAVENLVHNLEHGYTILWYSSDTISDGDRRALETLAATFNGSDPTTNKFIAAPWSEQNDGGAFPGDTEIILTRWVADPENPTDVTKQFGVRRGCARVSGEVVINFMEQYPQQNSPEPNSG